VIKNCCCDVHKQVCTQQLSASLAYHEQACYSWATHCNSRYRVPQCSIQQAHRAPRCICYALNRGSAWSRLLRLLPLASRARPPKAFRVASRDQHAAAHFSRLLSASLYLACSAEIRACGALCGAQVETMVVSPPTRNWQALMPHGVCRSVSRGPHVAVPRSQPCWNRSRQQLVRVGAAATQPPSLPPDAGPFHADSRPRSCSC
jgi:hypothetical protein